jgi:hypothetical protein
MPTKTEIEARRTALYDIVAEQYPMNVRHAFYLATVRGLVPKTEIGYSRIQWDLTVLRKGGDLPYDWIEDGTRGVVEPATYPNIATALQETADNYSKALWEEADSRVQIWIEKDGLTNVIYPVTGERDVPVYPARGYASLTFLHDAARRIAANGVPTYIYHLGDSDPSGENAGEVIERTLREMAPDADVIFERLAVTEEQIAAWNLPSRPTKSSDPRAARFGDRPSVELEAIEPNQLRALVQAAIERHQPPEKFKALKAEEARERDVLHNLVRRMMPKQP